MIDFPERRAMSRLSRGSFCCRTSQISGSLVQEAKAVATLPGTESESFAPTIPFWLHMRSGGVSLLLALSSAGPPRVLHWGPDLGDLAGPATAWPLAAMVPHGPGGAAAESADLGDAIIPEPSAQWRSSPGLSGAHDNRPTRPRFTAVSARLVSDTHSALV